MDRIDASHRNMSRVTWGALLVLLLTTVHHVYGAYLYHTPWRLHAALVSAVAAAVIAGSFAVVRRGGDDVFSNIAFWVFVAVTFVVPVLLIGIFEGGYNHVLKNVLYFAGAPASLMNELFPPPTYEMPNDLFFEMTGVMQLVPGSVTGWFLFRLLRSRKTVTREDNASFTRLRARRLDAGDRIVYRALSGVSSEPIVIPDTGRHVHLQFRRFAGCPVCHLHLRSFSRRHGEIVAAGIREVVVFHSTVDALLPYTADLPFAVIADPDKELYREFGVESSPRALLDPRAWPAIVLGLVRSLVAIFGRKEPVPSLNPRGGRFGLPADFLIAPDGRVLARKYGAHADDQWSVDEVLALSRDTAAQGATARRLAVEGGN